MGQRGVLTLSRAAADPPVNLADPLLRATALALLALLAWLALVGVLVAAARLGPRRGRVGRRRLALRLSPRAARPLVALALGAAIGVSASGAASAATLHVTAPRTPADSAAPGLPAAGWSGRTERSWPAAGWVASPPAPPPVAADLVSAQNRRDRAVEEVVVRRGDTLWSLAARQLGAGASDAQVATLWPRWWQANREVIGADPDRLRPGTRLTAPGDHSPRAAR